MATQSRNTWNVSLWINNDYGLYSMAGEHIKYSDNRDAAARSMLEALNANGITHTPDGYRYTLTGIRAAMVGM